MAVERKLKVIGPVAFSVDGGSNGLVTVAEACRFKVKASIVITANSLPTLTLEVKRVLSETTVLVGPAGNILARSDISAYTVALGSTIFQPEQDRPGIPFEQHQRATYEEEPTLANRSILVDECGEFYTKENPFQVQLSDGSINIGTVNADVDVQLTDKESALGENDYDIVRIGDGEDQLAVNPDGSINVNLIQSPPNVERSLNIYDEALSVVSGSETLIVNFNANVSTKKYSIQRVEFTGEQIAIYRLYVNGQNIATKRTHHGSGLSGTFEFIGGSQEGIFLATGDLVELKVLHNRVSAGDFEGRIQIFEVSGNVSYETLLQEDGFNLLTEDLDNLALEV